MNAIVPVLLTIAIWGVAYTIAYMYDIYIGRLDLVSLPDNATAIQVGVGVAFTLLFSVLICTLWQSWIQEPATLFVFGGKIAFLFFATFFVSGLPMFFGNGKRTRERRLRGEIQ